jgi:uncharacterized protein YwqG
LDIQTNLDEKMREYSPVSKEYALEISKAKVYMSESDYRFESLFREIAIEQQIKLKVEESLYNLIEEKAYDQMVEELTNTGHWVLGYPFFTQSDPRKYTEEYRYYDTMLFQLDSDYYDDGEGDMVLWGDCGVGNFFSSCLAGWYPTPGLASKWYLCRCISLMSVALQLPWSCFPSCL